MSCFAPMPSRATLLNTDFTSSMALSIENIFLMPLTGLNRALVAQGLRVMARRARVGLAALMEAATVRDVPSATTCGYVLGPRINAGGRVSEADLGLRLLLCDDPDAGPSSVGILGADGFAAYQPLGWSDRCGGYVVMVPESDAEDLVVSAEAPEGTRYRLSVITDHDPVAN